MCLVLNLIKVGSLILEKRIFLKDFRQTTDGRTTGDPIRKNQLIFLLMSLYGIFSVQSKGKACKFTRGIVLHLCDSLAYLCVEHLAEGLLLGNVKVATSESSKGQWVGSEILILLVKGGSNSNTKESEKADAYKGLWITRGSRMVEFNHCRPDFTFPPVLPSL